MKAHELINIIKEYPELDIMIMDISVVENNTCPVFEIEAIEVTHNVIRIEQEDGFITEEEAEPMLVLCVDTMSYAGNEGSAIDSRDIKNETGFVGYN